MTTSQLVPILLAAVAALLAVFAYLRREPRVARRGGLLGMRMAALLLLLSLLLNPALPGDDDVEPREQARWVLIDAGPALDVPDPEGGTLRERVIERAATEAEAGARLALAGPEPEGIDIAGLRAGGPRSVVEDPGPSILRLAEAGADSILVLSTFRMGRSTLERALADLPVPVRMERVGEPVRNAGVLELELPARVAADDGFDAVTTIFGEAGEEGDTVVVEISAEGQAVATRSVPLPPAGASVRVELELPPPPATGLLRYTASVELADDRFARDDERAARVRVGPPEGGIVLVSLRPDWEPRVLLPVLEAATGLEGEGYLHVGEDRWLPLGTGEDAAAPVGSEGFRERLSAAALLVVHGVDAAPPAWLDAAAQAHPRTIHLPVGPEGLRLAGLSGGPVRTGEWTPEPDVPPSPVAPYLSGIALEQLPPLLDARPAGDASGTAVLRVRSALGGESQPALLLRNGGSGRRAVALASGFWRWGNRTDEPRDAYRGLWSGVAGWLLASEAVAGEAAIRPIEPVVEDGAPFEWVARGGGTGDTLVVGFRPEPDSDVTESRRVPLDESGRGRSDPLPAGRWSWEGEVVGSVSGPEDPPAASDDASPTGSGEVEVEAWSGALAVPPLDPLPEAPETDSAAVGGFEPSPEGRRLRTHPLPYLLLLALLCGEWIARRRLGLR